MKRSKYVRVAVDIYSVDRDECQIDMCLIQSAVALSPVEIEMLTLFSTNIYPYLCVI
jgi:hypothetical protein